MTEMDETVGSDVKSAEEVLKMSGPDKVKFGLLIGFIKVGQVENKSVVDTVLNLLVGGEFDLETNFVIQDPENVLHMLELIENCQATLQGEIWSLFTAILRKSRRNLQACTEVSLIERVLQKLPNSEQIVADLLVDMLGVLASYSITVKELKLLFSLLKAHNGQWRRNSVLLLTVLKIMPERHGPDEFFSFPGKKGSAIALPPIKQFPYQYGWTFSTWFRLDPVTGVGIENEKPFIYCFRSSKGIGYTAHFMGNVLVLTYNKVKDKGFNMCVNYEFQPRKWYHLSLVHIYNRWSKSEIRCYVDGNLVSFHDGAWLAWTTDPFDKCYIGSNSDLAADVTFCGQISTAYLFNEALQPSTVYAMYKLGPAYKSQYRFENESVGLLNDQQRKLVYDGKLTNSIVFMYNPVSCDSQLILESSPKGNPSIFVHTPHALMLEGVKAVVTYSIHSTLHSIGGIQVLFPLFSQLDCVQQECSQREEMVDISVCTTLMTLTCDLLENSVTIQQQFIQNKGFLVISHMLEKSSSKHLTEGVLDCFLRLTRHLIKLASSGHLLKQLLDHILFNPALWIYADVEVQTKLYTYLATEFVSDTHVYSNIRRVSGVLTTMNTLVYYYWVVNPEHRSGIMPKGIDGPRPSREQIVALRAYILLYLKQLVIRGQGILEDELQAILNYLSTVHEDDNLIDVLHLLVTLMSEHPSSMVPAFDRKHGIRTVFKLLASSSEAVRIQSLKLLGYFLMRSTPKRKHDAMAPHNLFSLLSERLMLNTKTLTMTTYNTLFEILTERISSQMVVGSHPEPDSSFKLENSLILKVVAVMIKHSTPSLELMDVKKRFLSDLTIMCSNSKENKRIVLQMSVWQDWLFSLAHIYPRSDDEKKITDMVMVLFRILLHHAIKLEYGGWRVWIDTLAILHSKISYEDFRIHMSRMYQQYEQQRAENISDPQQRSEHPISTISGVSDTTVSDSRPAPKKSTVKITEITEDGTEDQPPKSIEQPETPGVDRDQPEETIDASSPDESDKTSAEDAEDTGEASDRSKAYETLGFSEEIKEFINEVVEKAVAIVENADGAQHDDSEVQRSDIIEDEPVSESQATGKTDAEKNDENEGQNSEVKEPVADAQETETAQPEVGAVASHEDIELSEKDVMQPGDKESNPQDLGNDVSTSEAQHDIKQDSENTSPRMRAASQPAPKSETGPNRQETGPNRQRAASQGRPGSTHQMFNPGPRAPPFRIPEFRWSFIHQKLLSDLLFTLETEIQVWKTHSSKTVIDFVNATENQVFVINTIHMISQLIDNLITAVGGLLPLLAAATSSNGEIDLAEPSHGLTLEQAMSFLQRLMNMTDILIFASSTTFNDLEREKNMQTGGILRQCLRMVCTCAVRNCLECQRRLAQGETKSMPPSPDGSLLPNGKEDPIDALIRGTQPSDKNIVENLGGQVSPIQDAERLLQDMDVNRLRAVIYRDVEETKQAQFLSLAVVYFSSVLMVSKYRDILEPPSCASTPRKHPFQSSRDRGSEDQKLDEESWEMDNTADSFGISMMSGGADSHSEEELQCEQVEVSAEVHSEVVNGEKRSENGDEDATEESAENDEEQEADTNGAEGDDNKEGNGEETTKEEGGGDAGCVTTTTNGENDQENQKPLESPETNAADEPDGTASKAETDEPSEGAPATHNVEKVPDSVPSSPAPDNTGDGFNAVASINLPDSSKSPLRLDLPSNIPATIEISHHHREAPGTLTDRLERALETVAPLLRELFTDFAPFLSKTLIGSHGQELVSGGLITLKESNSVVELVMLLCSQEWQNSLQKHAGLAFIELVNEGRLLAHATRDHIVRVANEAEFILNRMRAEDVQKHADFESLCAQSTVERKNEEKLCDHLIVSARRRDYVIATKMKDKIVNIMTDKHGAWGDPDKKSEEFWKLDSWEDDSRRRRRLVRNAHGSSHPEATLKAALEHGATEDAINQARVAFHAHLAKQQQRQQQKEALDVTDEELMSMEERDHELEFTGPVALSTPCQLIAPGVVVKGTMSITKSELYFEVDDEDPANKKMDAKVLAYVDHLHGKWMFTEIRAVFTRKFLLQNVAVEIFMSNRTAIMFSFPDHATVKKVINVLPRVGVGIKYGVQQARRTSFASPKQLFKMSGMLERWRRREISNFDYLMYLNTVAGRSYNDLNQYPVFPWVIVNYESSELDLSLPSNYRDLSKPIGALNPSRRAFFEERYASWEHEEIPPFHYGTHYSTSAFTLNWLIRMEPFSTMFLNLQGGKFDHADRTFHSVAQAWKNCQRDTSDVKELIPEFYFLPEMFVNESNYEMGVTDEKMKVNDVILPPWAKTPEDFVRIMRQALESEFVSCQLHQWIDLIFGYKQRGPEAVRATNVFYYLTYDGSVDLQKIADPIMKEAIENQIRCFGQTPSQLLTEPHPPRSSALHVSPKMFQPAPDDVCMIMKFLSNSPVTHVSAHTHPSSPTPAVVTISCNHNFAINKWNHMTAPISPPPSYAEKPEIPALPLSMDAVLSASVNSSRRNLGDNFDQRLQVTHSSFVVTADNKFIVACGFWDKSFRVFHADSAKIIQVVFGHFDIVTCIAKSECNMAQDCFFVTGSKDCTVMLWQWINRNSAIMGDNGSMENPTPKVTLTGHQEEVTCVVLSAELGLVISGSKDGVCLIHTTSGELLRSLDPAPGCTLPKLIMLTREGYIVINYNKGDLCTFSLNGQLMRHTSHDDNVRCASMSRDGQYIVTGGDKGIVGVWRSNDLNLLYTFPTCDSSIRTVALSHDQRYVLSGLGTGCVVVFNIDFNKWHHEFQGRY